MDVRQTRDYLVSPNFQVIRHPTAPGQDPDFSYLSLRSVIPGGRLTFPLFLKAIQNNSREIQYLPYCAAEEVFQAAWLAQLRQGGIERLYFRRAEVDRVIAYLNNHLLFLEEEEATPGNQRLMVLYDHLNLTLQQAFSGPDLTPEHLLPALDQVEQVLTELEDGTFPFQSLLEALCLEYSLYNHAANVFLLAVTFLNSLGKSPDDCRTVGIAALFHDIGFLQVPPDILQKPDPLSDSDRQLVQRHPQLGYDMLKSSAAVPLESLRLVLEHHENSDGSGYPHKLELWRQHPYTPILRMVDTYDAMTSHRPFRPAQTAFRAIETLRTQKGTQGNLYDQGILKSFIKFLALA